MESKGQIKFFKFICLVVSRMSTVNDSLCPIFNHNYCGSCFTCFAVILEPRTKG